jgi:hypothetical protein
MLTLLLCETYAAANRRKPEIENVEDNPNFRDSEDLPPLECGGKIGNRLRNSPRRRPPPSPLTLISDPAISVDTNTKRLLANQDCLLEEYLLLRSHIMEGPSRQDLFDRCQPVAPKAPQISQCLSPSLHGLNCLMQKRYLGTAIRWKENWW